MLFGILGANLFENMYAGKRVIKAGERVIITGKDFRYSSSFD